MQISRPVTVAQVENSAALPNPADGEQRRTLLQTIALVAAFGLIISATLTGLHSQDPQLPEAPSASTTDDAADGGWISLFDGTSLFGWRLQSAANWRVENGEICVDDGQPGLLRTTSQFDDYLLRLKFKAPAATNSGVFLRTSPDPTSPTVDCYEVNIADPQSHEFPTGSLVGRKQGVATRVSEQWNQLEISAQGGHIEIRINGENVLSYQDPKPLGRGYIGLQFREGTVRFKEIQLKPLGLDSLLSGRDLAGWIASPGAEGMFRTDLRGVLHVRGGPGQLESQRQFGDFVLQLQCKTNTPGANSGVFFRCVPGESMNGYESQIHNGTVEGDRLRPADAGSGALFRLTTARQVVASDQQWFSKTIVATGPHIAVWVDGYQVTDWTDKRKPDNNPRRGRRLQPGSIILQAHDGTTDVSFREIRGKELDPRGR